MVMRVKQIGVVMGDEIVCSPDRRIGDDLEILTNIDATSDPDPGPPWKVHVAIGEGRAIRRVAIELSPLLSREEYSSSDSTPVFLPQPSNPRGDLQLALFRNRIFAVEPAPRDDSMRDEAALRIKRHTYGQDAEVAALRSYIANIEAAVAYRSGPRRAPIPDDVKMLVWARDGGACTRCGSKSDLHFDHVIPVAKGGGNIAENIQLLCKPCNLRKSDKIAF